MKIDRATGLGWHISTSASVIMQRGEKMRAMMVRSLSVDKLIHI